LPTQGFVPLRGITEAQPHLGGGCHCLRFLVFRPQAFSASRRFAPPLSFAGLFHPATTSRVVAVQGLLSPCSRTVSSTASAPLPLSSFVLTGFPAARLGRPDFEAFLHTRPRSTRFGVTRTECRSPLRFSVSSRPSPPVASFGSPKPSAHDVTAWGLQADPSWPSSAYFNRRARLIRLLPSQPARDSRTFHPRPPW
jgi:hypothetical protein